MTRKTKAMYDKDAFGKTFDKLPDDIEMIDPASEEINVLSEIMALEEEPRCTVVKAVYLASVFRDLFQEGIKQFVGCMIDIPLVEQSFSIFEDLVNNFIFRDDIQKTELTSVDFPSACGLVCLRDKFPELCGLCTSDLKQNGEFLILSENRAYDLGEVTGLLREHLFCVLGVMDFAFRDCPIGSISEKLENISCENLSGFPDDEIFLLTLFEGKRLLLTEPETFEKNRLSKLNRVEYSLCLRLTN